MPAKSQRPSPVAPSADWPEAFQRYLQTALEKFHQVEWLGDHSPLSAPYFLGKSPSSTRNSALSDTAILRGPDLAACAASNQRLAGRAGPGDAGDQSACSAGLFSGHAPDSR